MLMPKVMMVFSFARPTVDETVDYAKSQKTEDIGEPDQCRWYVITDPGFGLRGRRGAMGGLTWYERIKDFRKPQYPSLSVCMPFNWHIELRVWQKNNVG